MVNPCFNFISYELQKLLLNNGCSADFQFTLKDLSDSKGLDTALKPPVQANEPPIRANEPPTEVS